jgi:hypothetical protein
VTRVRHSIEDIVDLERYPLHRGDSSEWRALVELCRSQLDASGMYELPDFVRSEMLASTVSALVPIMATASFEQRRRHNIYFVDRVEGLAADHPALATIETVNHTLCADQLGHTAIMTLYEWPPFRAFIAATIRLPALHLMDDPLARVNVLSYRPGEALNWHFDRSDYTITLLLQGAVDGGVFEYRSNLRTDLDPNYDGVGTMLAGHDSAVRTLDVQPGALNVFMGRNTAHRVTTVEGDTERMIAVLSLYDRAGVRFGDDECRGFYGRTATEAVAPER